MHDKLENHKMTPISELDETLFELNKNLKAIMVKIASKSLGEHARSQGYVLRQLLGHNFGFLGNDGGKNYQQIRSW